MDQYSSSAIIHTKLLPHEEKNFAKLYKRLKSLVIKDKELSKLQWTKNHTNSGIILKVYSNNNNFLDHKLFHRFVKLINNQFTIKPNIIMHKGAS